MSYKSGDSLHRWVQLPCLGTHSAFPVDSRVTPDPTSLATCVCGWQGGALTEGVRWKQNLESSLLTGDSFVVLCRRMYCPEFWWRCACPGNNGWFKRTAGGRSVPHGLDEATQSERTCGHTPCRRKPCVFLSRATTHQKQMEGRCHRLEIPDVNLDLRLDQRLGALGLLTQTQEHSRERTPNNVTNKTSLSVLCPGGRGTVVSKAQFLRLLLA